MMDGKATNEVRPLNEERVMRRWYLVPVLLLCLLTQLSLAACSRSEAVTVDSALATTTSERTTTTLAPALGGS